MNIKTLAMTAAIALATATAANAATNELKNGAFNNGLNKWDTFGGTTLGSYKGSDAAYLTKNSLSAGQLVQNFQATINGVYNLAFKFDAIKKLSFTLTDLGTGIAVLSKNIDSGLFGKVNTEVNLTRGSVYALSFISNKAYVDNVSVKSTVQVPGPEAGAGLGALAMGGVAFLIARRRRDAIAA